MIPDLDVDAATAGRILEAFRGWADHFRDRLVREGCAGLLADYARLLARIESQSCEHGPGGTVRTGDDFRACCGSFDEFTNDISVRNALQTIVSILPEPAAARLSARLEPPDARYRELQTGEEFILDPALTSKYPRTTHWWYYGLPEGIAKP